MLFRKGVEAALRRQERPLFTDLDLYLFAQALFAAGHWLNEPLTKKPKAWDYDRLIVLVGHLESSGALIPHTDFDQRVWRVEGHESLSPEASLCQVDPFCYLAFGSAMRHHGLTRRSPPRAQFLTPERAIWRTRRLEQVASIIVDDARARPLLLRSVPGEKIGRNSIVVHETAHPTTPDQVDLIRVASLGSTFVDMLTEPGRCGGMDGVLKVWQRHALAHLEAIIQAVDASEIKIVRVRAGHILNERLGVERAEISAWTTDAQRGGSRKLDPDRPYAPVFSERWMLSLNV